MKNIKKLFRGIWGVLLEPADDCGLFPIIARIGVYGFLLLGILYVRSNVFDYNELITVVAFTSIVSVIETMWRKTEAGKRLIWHFFSLVILVGFLGVLLNQATDFREAWYRTHVLEDRIQEIIFTSPTAIIVADGFGDIKYINSKATSIIGWTEDEIKGRPLTILMRPQKIAAHNRAFVNEVKSLKQGSASWIHMGDHVFRVVCKNGDIIKVKMYVMGIRYSSDDEPGKYPVGQDVEFYAIVQPLAPLIDPEEAFFDAQRKIDEAKTEETHDMNHKPKNR
jgi:PAS domain S-box-containing protein